MIAETGSCEYRLHSVQLGRSFLVCQSASELAQCGVWPRANPNAALMARVEGTQAKADPVVLQKTACDAERAVAVCLLPSSTIYFYEGDPAQLASGCARMRGEFKDRAPGPPPALEALLR